MLLLGQQHATQSARLIQARSLWMPHLHGTHGLLLSGACGLGHRVLLGRRLKGGMS